MKANPQPPSLAPRLSFPSYLKKRANTSIGSLIPFQKPLWQCYVEGPNRWIFHIGGGHVQWKLTSTPELKEKKDWKGTKGL